MGDAAEEEVGNSHYGKRGCRKIDEPADPGELAAGAVSPR